MLTPVRSVRGSVTVRVQGARERHGGRVYPAELAQQLGAVSEGIRELESHL